MKDKVYIDEFNVVFTQESDLIQNKELLIGDKVYVDEFKLVFTQESD